MVKRYPIDNLVIVKHLIILLRVCINDRNMLIEIYMFINMWFIWTLTWLLGDKIQYPKIILFVS